MNIEDVKRSAKGRWGSILPHFGVNHTALNGRHQPCPGCGGEDRFRYDDKQGDGDYYCNNCGAGDGFRLIHIATKKSLGDVINAVGEYLGTHADAPVTLEKAQKVYVTPVYPVPANAPVISDGERVKIFNPKSGETKEWQIKQSYPYKNKNGELLGYVIRKDIDGRKITPCLGFTLTHGWAIVNFPEPSPLYGAETLSCSGSVLVVEGEKTADAARSLFPNNAVVSWCGGSKRFKAADWASLSGRHIVFWPDNDPAGMAVWHGWHASGKRHEGLAEILLRAGALSLKCVAPPEDKKQGWDLADAVNEGWSAEVALSWLKGNTEEFTKENAPTGTEEAPPIEYCDSLTQHGYDVEPTQQHRETSLTREQVLRPLGVNGDVFYYLPRDQLQVRSLKASAHNSTNLLSLAPLAFWEENFPKKGADPVRWQEATDYFIQACKRKGIFTTHNLRGRGCWHDNGRVVVHLGTHLLVDGDAVDIIDFKSKFIYQMEPKGTPPSDSPLSDADSKKIIDACQLINWQTPAQAALLAGWIALAPICGAIPWRPHIWLTGGAGTGKTTVLRDLIIALLGDTAFCFRGDSSARGITQALGASAFPVVIDETEQNERKEQVEIQSILAMMRQASSETGMKTAKGTQTHTAVFFDVRSMFCLSSIGVGIKQKADADRISILSLKEVRPKNSIEAQDRAERWAKLQNILALFNGEFSANLFARSISAIETIRANTKTLSHIVALRFGSARLGDQYGALLAGAYSLMHVRVMQEKEAEAWIDRFDWTETSSAQEQGQEADCLRSILEARLSVEGERTRETLTIGEIIERILCERNTPNIQAAHLKKFLLDYGIKPAEDGVYFAPKSENLRRLLSDTPYSIGWVSMLSRLEGALKKPDVIRFGPAIGRQRGSVCVPLTTFME